MREWSVLLGGLTIWAAHFFVLYAIASALPGRPEANWLALAATLPALAGNGLILWKALAWRGRPDPLERWFAYLGAFGAAVSLLAVSWQIVPALLI